MKPEKFEPKQTDTKNERVNESHDILTEQKDDFELDIVDHELISKYKPKYLAKGGEHIVYELPNHPDIVIKVATNPLLEVINRNVKLKQPINSLSTESQHNLQDYITQELARFQQLKKFFGANHVPAQKQFIVKIPITQQILNSIYGGNLPETVDEVWSVVMVQKRLKALNDTSRLSLLAGYAPYDEAPEDLINNATEHLVFGKNSEEKIKTEELIKIKTHCNLKDLIKKSESDENLKETLKELIEKIIRYTNETGEILDIAGKDNIVIYTEDDKWTYKLVDTQFSDENKMIEKAKTSLTEFSEGGKINKQEKHELHNIFCFVWAINGLAEQVGSEKKINIIPNNINQKEIDFLKILH